MTIRLSATSIGRYKACPTRFRYADVERLRPIEDAEALRVGTNWHLLQEVYRKEKLFVEGLSPEGDPHEQAFNAAIDHLNAQYAEVPQSQTMEAWAVERCTLVALFIGHLWYWKADDEEIETLHCEQRFRLPLHEPRTGMPISKDKVLRVGMIDRLLVRNGMLMQGEYKTTGGDVGPESKYWPRLRIDTQVSFYDLAIRDGIEGGVLDLPDLPVGGCYYDVTRKPGISPKKLTQAESAAFVETGEYCGETFEVEATPLPQGGEGHDSITADGWLTEYKAGAKEGTFAIRETPGMYQARLVQDITERPEYYYARKEISRTQKERAQFRHELFAIYRSMKYAVETGAFYHNEDQCDQWGGCDYREICHNNIDVLDGHTPDGMRRTELTIKETD